MEGLTPNALGLLRARRHVFNAGFTAAQGLVPGLDGQAVLAHLTDTLLPIAEAVAAVHPDRAGETLERLYLLSLDLIGRGVIGPAGRHPVIGDGWRRLLGGLPELTATAPEAMARIVTNALHTLSTTAGTRPGQWIDLMAAVGPVCADDHVFAECGKVAAWRAGMAHYRNGALAVCAGLDASLAAALLELPDPFQTGAGQTGAGRIGAALAVLREDPWRVPAEAATPGTRQRLDVVARVGGFRGFGGPFLTPPRVAVHDGGIAAADAEAAFLLYADACGCLLVRLDQPVLPSSPMADAAFGLFRDGRVDKGGMTGTFPQLAEPSFWASDGDTLAVTLPDSHFVFLVAAS